MVVVFLNLDTLEAGWKWPYLSVHVKWCRPNLPQWVLNSLNPATKSELLTCITGPPGTSASSEMLTSLPPSKSPNSSTLAALCPTSSLQLSCKRREGGREGKEGKEGREGRKGRMAVWICVSEKRYDSFTAWPKCLLSTCHDVMRNKSKASIQLIEYGGYRCDTHYRQYLVQTVP